jgi:DNA-directed RNA polymerase subunit RPC12/RpoP
MGFWDWLFGKKNQTEKQPLQTKNNDPAPFFFHRPGPTASNEFTTIGNIDPVCPYCNHIFEKMPGRKKECPQCKNAIFVRTRPLDNKSVLLTKDQTIEVERQKKIRSGEFDSRKQSVYSAIRRDVRVKLGREPTNYEVMSAFFTEECRYFASRNDWGLYTNILSEQKKLTEDFGNKEEALFYCLMICYLDLNGQNNLGGLGGRPSPGIKRFDPKLGYLAPYYTKRIRELIEELNLSQKDVKTRFIEGAKKMKETIHTPVAVNTAWEKISSEVYGDDDLDGVGNPSGQYWQQ